VLARIAELNRTSEADAAPATESARTSYRVDASHSAAEESAPHVPPKTRSLHPAAALPATAAAPRGTTQRQERIISAAPLPIRAALGAWHWVQPHQRLIRLAAMVAVMSAAGMAMVLTAGGPASKPDDIADPAAATVETTAIPTREIQHAEHNPEIIPATGPSAETDTLEPTATGPLPPLSKPLMAIETNEPRLVLPYPTTVRPEPLEPIIAAGKLPQAQFEEEPEVARLKGTVEESQVR
jgi:hypothetical protein